MTDKSLYVFDKKIDSFNSFIENHKKYICTDIFWDLWEEPDKFYFGFDTLPTWYLDFVIEINELFNFLEVNVHFEIKNTYSIEEPMDCYYVVFSISFDEDISEILQKQYSYILQIIFRTITLSRMERSKPGYIPLLQKINSNEKTPRLNLLIGMSNMIRGQNRNLYSGILTRDILEKLADIEKAEMVCESFDYLKQTNFIKVMIEDEFHIPTKGDIIYVSGERHAIDVVFSLDFIKVISLETGQVQFCQFADLEYK